jgi:hypothetical protein
LLQDDLENTPMWRTPAQRVICGAVWWTIFAVYGVAAWWLFG